MEKNNPLQEEWNLNYAVGTKSEADSYMIQRLVEIVHEQSQKIKDLEKDVELLNKLHHRKIENYGK